MDDDLLDLFDETKKLTHLKPTSWRWEIKDDGGHCYAGIDSYERYDYHVKNLEVGESLRYTPVYTTDSVLGQIKKRSDDYFLVIEQDILSRGWLAHYMTNDYTSERSIDLKGITCDGDIPLKAVLKLIIDLSKLGEVV